MVHGEMGDLGPHMGSAINPLCNLNQVTVLWGSVFPLVKWGGQIGCTKSRFQTAIRGQNSSLGRFLGRNAEKCVTPSSLGRKSLDSQLVPISKV